MEITLDLMEPGKRALYLASLQTVISENKFKSDADGLGIGEKITPQMINQFKRTYTKVETAGYAVSLTKADLQHLAKGFGNLTYFYSFNADTCDLLFGKTSEQVDLYYNEIRHALKGKTALNKFYNMNTIPWN